MTLSFNVRIRLLSIDGRQIYDQEFVDFDSLVDYIVEYFAKQAEEKTEERVKQNVLKKPDTKG